MINGGGVADLSTARNDIKHSTIEVELPIHVHTAVRYSSTVFASAIITVIRRLFAISSPFTSRCRVQYWQKIRSSRSLD